MLGPGVWLAIGSLALCVASSARAQGDLDQGKTAAQLYAAGCATCHKSLQSVSNTKWFFGLRGSRLRRLSHTAGRLQQGFAPGEMGFRERVARQQS
jgi:cytochrome c553